MDYIFHIIILIALYVMLALSLELLAGQTGLLSLAHAAFYGIGAYSSAILTGTYEQSFITGLLVGCLVAVAVSLLISLTSIHLYEDYFVIATFGFQLVIYGIYNNWVDFTGGPYGISRIPKLSFFGYELVSTYSVAIIAILSAGLIYLLVYRICFSPFGRVIRAIREDEVFARSLGKNTFAFKAKTLAVSAVIAAFAGNLYAHYITYIDPHSFTLAESVLILSMVIVGGAGNLWGSIIGAVVLVSLPEVLRLVGLPVSTAYQVRQILYGSGLVLIMMFRPKGILGKYSFGR